MPVISFQEFQRGQSADSDQRATPSSEGGIGASGTVETDSVSYRCDQSRDMKTASAASVLRNLVTLDENHQSFVRSSKTGSTQALFEQLNSKMKLVFNALEITGLPISNAIQEEIGYALLTVKPDVRLASGFKLLAVKTISDFVEKLSNEIDSYVLGKHTAEVQFYLQKFVTDFNNMLYVCFPDYFKRDESTKDSAHRSDRSTGASNSSTPPYSCLPETIQSHLEKFSARTKLLFVNYLKLFLDENSNSSQKLFAAQSIRDKVKQASNPTDTRYSTFQSLLKKAFIQYKHFVDLGSKDPILNELIFLFDEVDQANIVKYVTIIFTEHTTPLDVTTAMDRLCHLCFVNEKYCDFQGKRVDIFKKLHQCISDSSPQYEVFTNLLLHMHNIVDLLPENCVQLHEVFRLILGENSCHFSRSQYIESLNKSLEDQKERLSEVNIQILNKFIKFVNQQFEFNGFRERINEIHHTRKTNRQRKPRSRRPEGGPHPSQGTQRPNRSHVDRYSRQNPHLVEPFVLKKEVIPIRFATELEKMISDFNCLFLELSQCISSQKESDSNNNELMTIHHNFLQHFKTMVDELCNYKSAQSDEVKHSKLKAIKKLVRIFQVHFHSDKVDTQFFNKIGFDKINQLEKARIKLVSSDLITSINALFEKINSRLSSHLQQR